MDRRQPGRLQISIHALREEGDDEGPDVTLSADKFLSTPSARRATTPVFSVAYSAANFYPRPPRGGRRDFHESQIFVIEISIHALREEGDRYFMGLFNFLKKFLSTPSARRATANGALERANFRISIHALREEGDPLVKTYHVLL